MSCLIAEYAEWYVTVCPLFLTHFVSIVVIKNIKNVHFSDLSL